MATIDTKHEAPLVGLSIQQAASQLELSVHTLRYYERAGLVPMVPRTAGGRRSYSSSDLGWASFVCKLRRAGLGIRAIREYARLQQSGPATLVERVELLRIHREQLDLRIAEMQETLAYLDGKIAHYEEVLAEQLPDDCV